jgi:uncharacterized membrane protein YecN with MAPEG domain
MPDAIVLPITLTIAGAAAVVNLWLGARVSRLRLRHKISVGDEGNAQLACRMRAQANFIEYTPLFLILLGLIELARGSQTWLWAVAILYMLGRLAHPFGMDRPAPNRLRMIGILITWLVLVGLALYALAIPYLERYRPVSIQYTAAEV